MKLRFTASRAPGINRCPLLRNLPRGRFLMVPPRSLSVLRNITPLEILHGR